MYFYALFADDPETGSMVLVATYLDEHAVQSHGKKLSPSGDGIAVIQYQALNAIDLPVWGHE
jgi:hypothetical protein